MARTVVITDDIDGSPNAETVRFSFEGTAYEIDLVKKNRSAFERAVRPYAKVARRTSGRRPSAAAGRGRRSASRRADLATIRAWAAAQGLAVSGRGRIPQNVLDAYNAAH